MATSRHLEKVLAHAEDQLALAGKRRPTEVLSTYKKFLKLEEHRLRLKHQAGGGGREVCARRAELVDILVQYALRAAAAAAAEHGREEVPLALITVGRSGRGDRNPCSAVHRRLVDGQRD